MSTSSSASVIDAHHSMDSQSYPMESPSMMSDMSDKAITPGTTTVNLLATANTNTMSDTEKSSQSGAARGGAEIKMAKGRKWLLLAIFSLAQFLDLLGRSGLLGLVSKIIKDLDLAYETSAWVVTSFSATFGCFLLMWGRVADLFSPKSVFVLGFGMMGVFSLLSSFMTNQYAYYIMRAITGIFAAATIPSAYRLIMAVFEPEEAKAAITIFSLTGAIGNALGLIVGGVFGIDTAGGQMANWRWFFRFICALSLIVSVFSLPFALISWLLVPKLEGSRAKVPLREKLAQFDLIGTFATTASMMMLILALTFGAAYGWGTAKFIVPFLLTWVLLGFFFLWERRLPEGAALIPPKTWKLPNVALLTFVGIGVFQYWPLPLLERWEIYDHTTVILAAVRILPMGLAAFLPAIVVTPLLPRINVRYLIVTGFVLAAVGLVPLIYSNHGAVHGSDYWRHFFPGLVVGSLGTCFAYIGVNMTIIMSVPPQMAGVISGLAQMVYQVGAVTGLSIQAGLLTVHPGDVSNWSNIQTSYWFDFGWALVCGALVLVLYRDVQGSGGEEQVEAGSVELGKAGGEVEAH
ncbi:hypothetical protein JCM24511_09592 [Saitozyma sp. JCM 24511]|nr:hypothetical protein JCM24511_09592 [Saitozyma sp. JCM 24511]